ncbi:MAG: hypothetical protein IKP46_07460 [Bacteroidales bacterium]|nr:hypothetical protein [Bacteroidales bacterium]
MKKSYILTVLLLAALSCGRKDPNAERPDFIRVYDSPESDIPIERTWISVQGGTATYYLRSNVDFEAKWQDSGEGWATLGAPVKVQDGLWKIELTARPLSERTLLPGECLYQRRYGNILFTSADRFLGNYFKVEQGMQVRYADDFSWLNGSAEPNATHKDLPISRWTTAQQAVGYTASVLPGQEMAFTYSKEGYVKIGGDKAIGADLMTPRIPGFLNDTLVVVTFDAVVQNGDILPDFSGGTEPIVPMALRTRAEGGEEETVDTGSLTVRLSGGGYIRDFTGTGGTSITFDDIPTYDLASPSYPSDIFEGSRYILFIEGTDQNPVGVNTTIHFEAGDMSGAAMERCNRIFIDNLCIYRFSVLFDEDIFPLIGHSGKDTVL